MIRYGRNSQPRPKELDGTSAIASQTSSAER